MNRSSECLNLTRKNNGFSNGYIALKNNSRDLHMLELQFVGLQFAAYYRSSIKTELSVSILVLPDIAPV